MPTAYVYVYLEEGPVPAGILERSGTGREAGARFRYGRRYLQREDRLAIDLVQLPLTAPDADREYITEEDLLSSTVFVMQPLMVGAVISWNAPLAHWPFLNSISWLQQEILVLERWHSVQIYPDRGALFHGLRKK